ncbi:MAG TPA: glycosyltransferase family 4 protein [Thermoanaerobaculia bacterium]|jgi:glycosyltransferase involved in cell wall biosynthesis|nr:glycosyltransferase family 4 protein [Thermoanaerobaculia bacterium]
MRILFMADVPRDPFSGAAGTEVRTIAALRDLGHTVDEVWAPELGRRIAHGNLHYLLELPRAYERAAARHFADHDYDVVHVNQPHGYRVARWLGRHRKHAVMIHRSHGIESHVDEVIGNWEHRLGEKRPLPRRVASSVIAALLGRHMTATARIADGHIVSSSGDASFLRRRFEIDEAKIAVVPQAAPDSFLMTPVAGYDDERQRTVLYVGQFAFVKAPMVTAAAMNAIVTARPDARLIWVCDRAHHNDVRALLSGDAVDRIELLHWTAQDDLRIIYDRAGVFLFPSFFEGFGKAFLEAMSRGVCVVATRVGGAPDVIHDSEDGVLIDPGDAGALTEAALALMSDSGRARSMSTAAVDTARRHSWGRVAREISEFYGRRLEAKLG